MKWRRPSRKSLPAWSPYTSRWEEFKFIPSEAVTKFIPSEARDQRSSRDETSQVAAPPLIPRSARDNLPAALKHWLLRPQAGLLLAVAFTFRLCEFAVVSMIKPYWVDRGYTPAEIGTITSIVGVIVSIGSAILGGFIVARIGIYASLLWLGAAQCLSNVGYALVATFSAGRWAIYAAAIGENIGYGLGTAAFLAFLMSICDRDRAATEYALLSAAYGLTGTVMAAVSGYLAKHAGYPLYFWITVLLGIPPLLLIPLIRDETSNLHA